VVALPSSCRARNEWDAGERLAGFIVKVQSLAFDDQWPVMHLRVYVADVFADDAHEQQLERAEQEHSDRNGSDAEGELAPEQ
jgi:hypothetical protein